MKVEVAVLGSPYGLYGRKATLNSIIHLCVGLYRLIRHLCIDLYNSYIYVLVCVDYTFICRPV